MNRHDLGKVKPGDQVYWKDPDAGACSRIVTIKSIQLDKIMSHGGLTTNEDDSIAFMFHELFSVAEYVGMSEEDLDEAVTNAFCEMAANVNNEGRDSQIAWLIENS